MSVTYAYAAEIVKSERDANGDLLVYGKATGPDLDLDGQICDPSWLKSAAPEWMTWGNVREMHQPIAAGVGVELEAIGEDWWLKSKCIDPGTAAKIDSGVLKGYSVGIKNPKVIKDALAPGGRIVGGTIVEISYVDRPCNPTAKMTICKSAPAGGDMQPVEAPETPEVGDAEAEPSSPGGAGDSPAAPVADLGLKRQGADMVRRVRKLVPELATLDKAAPDEDIVTARQACALIAQLIVSEAQDIADGAPRGSYQVGCLLDAVRSLEYFCEMESMEAESAVDIDLAVTPDDTKTSGTMPDESTITAMITKAVTEATTTSEERVKALEAQLAKVTATPIPGGPVLARPVQSIAAAEGRSTALAKAAEYERRASEMHGVDHAAAQGYRDLAAQERARVKV
jgi:hypothetical protein